MVYYLKQVSTGVKGNGVSHQLTCPYGSKGSQPPGSLVHVGTAHTAVPEITLICFGPEHHAIRKGISLEEAAKPDTRAEVVWLDITGLHDVSLLKEAGERFSIFPLTLEDILNTHQRPKAEFFEQYVFCVLKVAEPHPSGRGLVMHQLSLILQPGRVISFQEKPNKILHPLIHRIETAAGRIREFGADYLFHAILDIVVDQYFLCLELLGEEIEGLESRALDRPDQALVPELQKMKRELLFLRKALWPLREAVNALLRDGHPLIKRDTDAYFRDLYDHTVQIIDTVELFRDMASGLLDVYLSSINNRMSEVMKILAIISTIFMPMSFIAGIYGMNFRHMPELDVPWAYPLVLLLCLSIAGGMLVFFRRRHWL